MPNEFQIYVAPCKGQRPKIKVQSVLAMHFYINFNCMYSYIFLKTYVTLNKGGEGEGEGEGGK